MVIRLPVEPAWLYVGRGRINRLAVCGVKISTSIRHATQPRQHTRLYVAPAIQEKPVSPDGMRYIALYAMLWKLLLVLEEDVIDGEILKRESDVLEADNVDVLLGCVRAAREVVNHISVADFVNEEALQLALLSSQGSARHYAADHGGTCVRSVFLTVLLEVQTAVRSALPIFQAQEASPLPCDSEPSASDPQCKPHLGRLQFELLVVFATSLLSGLEGAIEGPARLSGQVDSDAIDTVLACTDAAMGMMWEVNEYGVWDERSRRPVEALMEAHLTTGRLGAGGSVAEEIMREAFLDLHRMEVDWEDTSTPASSEGARARP